MLFDKSFLEGLNPDEAALFGQLHSPIIAPVFFLETRADLAKASRGDQSAQKLVASLAYKTPVLRSYVTTNHRGGCTMNLLGYDVPMDRRPAMPRGKPTRVNGSTGVFFGEAPEMKAFARWTVGEFSALERQLAEEWRISLGGIDLKSLARRFAALRGKRTMPRSFEDARNMAREIVTTAGETYRRLALLLAFHVDPPFHKPIVERWKSAGSPSLQAYAPYAAYVFEVDVFFFLAVEAGLIGSRVSNRTDCFYLYYLPFGMAFVSSDRLHQRTAPLFLSEDQTFIDGSEMKADLRRIDESLAHLTEAEREDGLTSILPQPPTASLLVAGLWDKFLPNWRARRAGQEAAPEAERRQFEEMKAKVEAMKSAPPMPHRPSSEEVDTIVVERYVAPRMGRWWVLPRRVAQAQGIDC